MWIKKQLKKEKKETFNSTVLCVLNVCWFPSGSFQWKDSHLLKFINWMFLRDIHLVPVTII